MGRWWEGYPADIGRAVSGGEWAQVWQALTGEKAHWVWQGAEYPSATFPMRPSVLIGWEEVVNLLLNKHKSGRFALDGYSQGALVSCLAWKHDVLDPNGRLHHRLNDCVGIFTQGNPMRAPGIAYGNTLLWNKPVPGKDDGHTTGGIAGPANLRPEECLFPKGHPLAGSPAVFDFALPGDLYAAAPCGDDPWEHPTKVGSYETLIYESVLDFNGGDLFAWAKTIFKTIGGAWWYAWPMIQAIWNGIEFAKAGPNAPHWQYDIWPAVRYMEELGRKYA